MIIKEEIRENCDKCGRFVRQVSPEQHGCDQCKKPIQPYGNNDERLEVTVFTHADGSNTKHYLFCSWRCVFAFLEKVRTDYFISLPYVSFDNKIVGRRARDFKRLIRLARLKEEG